MMSRFCCILCFIFLLPLLSTGKKSKKTKPPKNNTKVINIKTFGAKGDGVFDDGAAFRKAAAFINSANRPIRLFIPKGIYVFGTDGQNIQEKNIGKRTACLFLENVTDIEIFGEAGTVIKCMPNQKFGSFDPSTKQIYSSGKHFTNALYRNDVGAVFFLESCKNITIKNLELNGNISKMEIGGQWGDAGIQLVHDGLIIFNSESVTVSNVKAHHFGRDGIMIGNANKNPSVLKDNKIMLTDCSFEYNGRQGLSWIGGSGLRAIRCKFNYSGKNGIVQSPPSAGVDIEAEWGTISQGSFIDCEIIDNAGVGFVADSGESSSIEIKRSKFVGLTAWSFWTVKPKYKLYNCDFYGSVVHSHDALSDSTATQFIKCNFNDYYDSKKCFGNFLIEINGRRRVLFDSCNFIAHTCKLMWLDGTSKWSNAERPRVQNCSFFQKSVTQIIDRDYLFVARVSNFKNNKFYINEFKEKMRSIYMQNAGSDWSNNIVIYKDDKDFK